LLPLVRHRYQPWRPAVRALLERNHDVRIPLDARLQLRAAAALKTRIDGTRKSSGSAVVLDADTGDVLASVSYPWPSGDDITRRDWMGTAPDLHERVLDRSRYGLYPPGSIFKLVVAGAALSRGTDATFACVRLPDGRVGNFLRGSRRPVRDDLLDTRPHGQVNLHEGIVHSCNAYFAQLAQQLGARAVVDAASLFQIDAARVSTAAGLQPTLPHAGYGQGEVVVSPIKMARVAAAVAAGGVVRPPRWDAGPAPRQPDQRFLSASAAARLGRDMRAVVTEGTGKVLGSNRTAIAGKTGTAEVGDGPAHSWFVGFAPYDAQTSRIAFSVIVENAGYGARSAAPVAGEIVTAARELGLFR
jgi:peptidoglycan glycosyltransferase